MFENLKKEYLLFTFLWPIIIAPKQLQLLIIGIILILLYRREKIYFDAISYLITFYIVIYASSIIYNLIHSTYEMDRILATLNTFSIWVVALLFYFLYKQFKLDVDELKKITFVNYSILIVLWFSSMVLYVVIGKSELSILNKLLYYTEWFNGSTVVRFVGLMDYANLVIMFSIFFYPLFCDYVLNKFTRWQAIILIIFGLMPVYSTYSRSGYIIILLAIFLYVLIYRTQKLNDRLKMFLGCSAISIVILSLLYTSIDQYLFANIDELLNAREGSNDSRSFLMKKSIEVVLGNSPIIGMGIKEVSTLGYPLGSHSTFVGFLYKTGVIGFSIGSLLFTIISMKIMFLKNSGLGNFFKMFILVMPLIFIVEDLDGSNWLIVMYFVVLGILFNTGTRDFTLKDV